MLTGKLKDVEKTKAVPEWLNSSVWSAKPTSPVVMSTDYNTVEEYAYVVGENELHLSESDGRASIQTENERNGESDDDLHSSYLGLTPIPAAQSSPQWMSIPCFNRSPSVDVKLERFSCELSRKVIDLTELQMLASEGIPDYQGLRATVWKLLLGYLPRNRDLWEKELVKKRTKYAVFKEEFLVNPSEVTRRMEEDSRADKQDNMNDEGGLLRRHEITHGDHPLSLGESSVWHQFFQDTEVTEQIERDVKRTHPDMHFFSGDSASSLDNQEAMKRILLIFAKLNPAIQYVQGMNEVLAPLYYVFKTDPDEGNAVNAEADAFSCFVELISAFLDHYCKQLDNSAVGIRSTIAQMAALLKMHDEELWHHLDAITKPSLHLHTFVVSCHYNYFLLCVRISLLLLYIVFTALMKVNPEFYAFRWITLLLTQEFSFPHCLRIWDSLLSNPYGPLEILLRICCAMLICIRSRLLAGDFTSNLKLLQHYPFVDINHLLHVANELRTTS